MRSPQHEDAIRSYPASRLRATRFGGVPQLAAKIPIRNFVDHGQNFETAKDNAGVYHAYQARCQKGNRMVVKAGDRIPIHGIQVDIVTEDFVNRRDAAVIRVNMSPDFYDQHFFIWSNVRLVATNPPRKVTGSYDSTLSWN